MIIRRIRYEEQFVKDLHRLDRRMYPFVEKAERFFRENPLHPSLRLHALKGKMQGHWSLSVTMSIRIIFKRHKNGDIVFLRIGRHDVYHA